MFPKNKIDIFYRVLCLICYIVVIVFTKNISALTILLCIFSFFALCEKNFKYIELIFITLLIILICYLLNNYIAFRVILVLDYIIYFLDTSNYVVERKVKVSEKEYIRFSKKEKEKGSNNILAVYLTVHLALLFLAILVG